MSFLGSSALRGTLHEESGGLPRLVPSSFSPYFPEKSSKSVPGLVLRNILPSYLLDLRLFAKDRNVSLSWLLCSVPFHFQEQNAPVLSPATALSPRRYFSFPVHGQGSRGMSGLLGEFCMLVDEEDPVLEVCSSSSFVLSSLFLSVCVQFYDEGCPNCGYLQMDGDRHRVWDCTTVNFAGFLAIMKPLSSWVARHNKLSKACRGGGHLSGDEAPSLSPLLSLVSGAPQAKERC